ncbi:hypothetical protein EYF80_000153 [Liparis tanakae]|uniref:Uncharacterized protein n=1 Tax=Liparis tanakae TaxID=230148 RepID=A0A4Z2JHA0_9TELE|nr:hypothetical protein EYF80_000153 [Liparis tanakae]
MMPHMGEKSNSCIFSGAVACRCGTCAERTTDLELLPELRLVLSGTWSLFSAGISEAEADDDWDDTDSLLPIEIPH